MVEKSDVSQTWHENGTSMPMKCEKKNVKMILIESRPFGKGLLFMLKNDVASKKLKKFNLEVYQIIKKYVFNMHTRVILTFLHLDN